jgi:DNA-binding response OmpR family regulator
MDSSASERARIVVTDDDPLLLARIVETLRHAGHAVFAAYDSGSACELALIIPDLALLVTNTRMGSTTVRDLIRRIRTERPGLRILHVGEPLPYPELRDVPSLREPFTPEELMAAVRPLLRR